MVRKRKRSKGRYEGQPPQQPEKRIRSWKYSARNWCRLFGFGGIGLGALSLMPALLPFWVAIAIAWAGCAVTIVGIIFFENLAEEQRVLRATLVLCAAILGSAFLFRAAPLEIQARVLTLEHTAEMVEGIRWQKGYGDLRVDIVNDTDREYERLDIEIDVSPSRAMIYEIAQIENGIECSFPKLIIDMPPPRNILPPGYSPDPVSTLLDVRSSRRLICNSLPSRSRIKLVLATTRPFPQRFSITGQYTVGIRPITLKENIKPAIE